MVLKINTDDVQEGEVRFKSSYRNQSAVIQ